MERITTKRVYELALMKALDIWSYEEQKHNESPNEFTHSRVNKAWDEVKQIEALVRECQ